MIIEVLTTCSGEGFLYMKGATVERVPEYRALDLEKAGYVKILGPDADPVDPDAAPVEHGADPAPVQKRKATRYETPEDGLNVETR